MKTIDEVKLQKTNTMICGEMLYQLVGNSGVILTDTLKEIGLFIKDGIVCCFNFNNKEED